MSGLDRMKIRLGYVGGSAEGRILKDRLKTLHKALNYSYQSSTIVINDEEHKALINPDRLKMDYDDKIISADFELNLKPGDIFYWKETKTNWIIYSQQLAERAYFRGSIRDCRHQIKWKNELGQIRTTYAAVRGPVETKVVNDMKRGITYDIPNYTLSILIPDTPLFLNCEQGLKSANARKLDDYYELDANVNLVASGGTLTIGATNKVISSVKVGQNVNISGYLDVSVATSPTGTLTITGLPHTCRSGLKYDSELSISVEGVTIPADHYWSAYVINNTTTIRIRLLDLTGAVIDASPYMTTNAKIRIGGVYNASS